MQQLPPSPRSGNRRLVTAVIAILALSAAFVAGYLVRGRLQSGTGGAPTASAPSPSADRSPTATDAAGSGGAPTCTPAQSGTLREDTQFTADDGAGTAVKYSISLPDDYYSACKQYPVIYALHGKTQNNVNFMDEALTMRRAMAAGALEQSIIVTPDSYSTGRWENRETGPAEDNVIKYLIPYVEQNYRVKPGPAYRLLTGFSMGGHGALRFGLKYPDMFAAVWSVDGAMAGSENYLPFVQGKSSGDFRIIAAGGQLNGSRVKKLLDDLKQAGIAIPYTYEDLPHEFPRFVAEDEKTGWPALKYLQQHLGQAM